MQIHEITFPKHLHEAAPGSLGGQASVLGKSMLGSLTQKLLPGANMSSPSDSVAPTQAQGKAAELSAGAVQALAKNQQALWVKIAQDMMSKTRNPATQAQGVLSISEVPPSELRQALLQQVNTKILSVASGRNISNYQDLPKLVDPNTFGGKATQLAKQFVQDIDASMDVILSTEPTKANSARLQQAWGNLVSRVYQAANMVEFQGGAPAKTMSKPTRASPLTQKAQQAGITAQQLGINNVNVRPTGNAKADAVLQAIGLQTPASTPATV